MLATRYAWQREYIEMIVANLATYPPRTSNLLQAITAIAPQVDRLNVVLTQYIPGPEGLRLSLIHI